MMFERYSQRINDLISQGISILNEDIGYIKDSNPFWNWDRLTSLYAWESSCLNCITHLLGQKSHHYMRFPRFEHPKTTNRPQVDFEIKFDMNKGLGILHSILDDIENELVFPPEIRLTKDVLTQIHIQAFQLHKSGFYPVACIYTRVYVENLLKKISDRKNLAFSKDDSISKINQTLKDEDVFETSEWRQMQTWIDLGNEAAHGNFSNCDARTVGVMLKEVTSYENKFVK